MTIDQISDNLPEDICYYKPLTEGYHDDHCNPCEGYQRRCPFYKSIKEELKKGEVK